MEFTFDPYEGALPVTFGMTAKQVRSVLGTKESEVTSRKGKRNEYRQSSNIRVGFSQDKNTVVDIALCPDDTLSLMYNGIDLLHEDSRFSILLKEDDAPLEMMGFLVFPKLGIGLTGFHDGKKSQRAITVFAKDSIDFSRLYEPFDVNKIASE